MTELASYLGLTPASASSIARLTKSSTTTQATFSVYYIYNQEMFVFLFTD